MDIKGSRSLRIFISSTFRDMKKERERLINVVFPRVRAFARERDVDVTEVDLRWGITEEQAQRGETLRICLEEIYKCKESPVFFIGLLGNRYGWIPDNLSREIEESLRSDTRFKALIERHGLERGKSVTELEILYGVLENPEEGHRAFFYIRGDELSADILKGLGIEDNEPEESKSKQKALIDRVRKLKEPKARVKDYKDINVFTNQIEKDLKETIEEIFPLAEKVTEVEKRRSKHEAYARDRKRFYIRDEEFFKEVKGLLGDEKTDCVVIEGGSGRGKSAFIANLADDIRGKDSGSFVIEHYIGGGGEESADYVMIMQRVIGEIRERLGQEGEEGEGEELFSLGKERRRTDKEGVAKEFIEAIGDISRQGYRTYILIDALNQIEPDEGKGLWWLPVYLPKGVKVVLTTIGEGRILEAIGRSERWKVIEMPLLDDKKKGQLTEDYLGFYGKSLTDEQLDKVKGCEHTSNPLFLKSFLEEIRVFGEYEGLDNKIEELLGVEDIDDLFEKVMKRSEEKYGEFVSDFYKLIYVSRDGLREHELLELLSRVRGREVSRLELSTLMLGIEMHLINKGGNISFSHPYFRKAVKDRYFGDKKEEERYRGELIGYYGEKLEAYRKGEGADIEKVARELPYQYYCLGKEKDLFNTYSDIEILRELVEKDEGSFVRYFSLLRQKDSGHEEGLVEKVLRDLRGKEGEDLGLILRIAKILKRQNAHRGSIKLEERALEITEPLYNQWAEDYTTSLNNLAYTYTDLNRDQEALELFEKALKITEALYNQNPDLWAEYYTLSLNNLASTYKALNRHQEALELLEKALKIREALYNQNPDRWAEYYTTSLNNLASTYYALNRHQEALELFEKALKIRETLYNQDPDRWAGYYTRSLNNLAYTYYALNRHGEALKLFEKALKIKVRHNLK